MRDIKRSLPGGGQEITPCWDQRSPGFLENGDNLGQTPGSRTMAAPNTHSTTPQTAMTCLMKTIEAEIIPRLMAAYEDVDARIGGAGGGQVIAIDEKDVHDFTDVAIGAESAKCMQYVDSIRDRGVPVQSIYLHLLAPAARRLGGMWTSDTCDFTQITIALWRMQQVMYDLSPSFHADASHGATEPKKIMLATVPGSQHTMGILMVAEFFRRAGWGVWGEPACSRERLLKEVRGQWFDAAGISVGSEAQLPGLDRFIDDLRESSKNKSLAVLVGGPIFADLPGLAQEIGADGTAEDAQSAVEKAELLLAVRRSPPAERRGLRVR